MLQTTSQVELVGAAEVGGEGGNGPDGGGGEEAGEDRRRVRCLAADDGYGSAAEGSNGSGFFGGVAEPLAGEGRLDLEDGVDALGGKVKPGRVREQRRRIE